MFANSQNRRLKKHNGIRTTKRKISEHMVQSMKRVNDCPHVISQFFLMASLIMVFIISCSPAANSVGKDNTKPKQAVQKMRSAQIIIKFKDNNLDPSRDEFVKGISLTAKANLSYIRSMSGGAYVFRVDGNGDTVKIEDIVARLLKRPDVLSAEPDEIMVHQQ
jgi:hypothetical protein